MINTSTTDVFLQYFLTTVPEPVIAIYGKRFERCVQQCHVFS